MTTLVKLLRRSAESTPNVHPKRPIDAASLHVPNALNGQTRASLAGVTPYYTRRGITIGVNSKPAAPPKLHRSFTNSSIMKPGNLPM